MCLAVPPWCAEYALLWATFGAISVFGLEAGIAAGEAAHTVEGLNRDACWPASMDVHRLHA